MKLSKRSQYGLRALLDLAIGECDTPVPLKELADRNNLPFKFMEHIFLSLRNAGFVLSHAGSRGGYTLARTPGEISLGEVIRTLDGTIAPVSCTSKIAYEPCACPDESTCLLRPVMHQVRDAIVNIVDNTSIADIISQAKTQDDG